MISCNHLCYASYILYTMFWMGWSQGPEVWFKSEVLHLRICMRSIDFWSWWIQKRLSELLPQQKFKPSPEPGIEPETPRIRLLDWILLPNCYNINFAQKVLNIKFKVLYSAVLLSIKYAIKVYYLKNKNRETTQKFRSLWATELHHLIQNLA